MTKRPNPYTKTNLVTWVWRQLVRFYNWVRLPKATPDTNKED